MIKIFKRPIEANYRVFSSKKMRKKIEQKNEKLNNRVQNSEFLLFRDFSRSTPRREGISNFC